MSTHPRRLLLVRHGLPDYRARKRSDEPPGPPLSPTGHDQARQAAAVVAPLAPQRVYTSPLARTRQTAEWIARAVDQRPVVAIDLKEWHRTERLYEVNLRQARWLRQWLAGDETCAVVVSHASPLLSIIRTATYLPHRPWWRAAHPHLFVLSSCDRFEFRMAAVYEVLFEDSRVTARRLFDPRPQIVNAERGGRRPRFPRPGGARSGEFIERPLFRRLVGWPT